MSEYINIFDFCTFVLHTCSFLTLRFLLFPVLSSHPLLSFHPPFLCPPNHNPISNCSLHVVYSSSLVTKLANISYTPGVQLVWTDTI